MGRLRTREEEHALLPPSPGSLVLILSHSALLSFLWEPFQLLALPPHPTPACESLTRPSLVTLSSSRTGARWKSSL